MSHEEQQKIFENLHRKELKGKLLFRNTANIKLSKEECDAAYKLAAALANYDKDDYRSLKFLDIEVFKFFYQKRSKNKKAYKLLFNI